MMFSSVVVFRVSCVSLMPRLLIDGHFEHIFFSQKCQVKKKKKGNGSLDFK